jgi:hypothetical protein
LTESVDSGAASNDVEEGGWSANGSAGDDEQRRRGWLERQWFWGGDGRRRGGLPDLRQENLRSIQSDCCRRDLVTEIGERVVRCFEICFRQVSNAELGPAMGAYNPWPYRIFFVSNV